MDVEQGLIEIHRAVGPEGYQQVRTLRRGERLSPAVLSQGDLDRLEAEKVVSWLGEVADVRPIVARADVVVLPSYREGIPRALLEAAAMGKPLITTDAVGCREVADDRLNGLRVPVKDAQALAQAMVRLIEYPAMRERMGKPGREEIQQEFDEGRVLEDFAGLRAGAALKWALNHH